MNLFLKVNKRIRYTLVFLIDIFFLYLFFTEFRDYIMIAIFLSSPLNFLVGLALFIGNFKYKTLIRASGILRSILLGIVFIGDYFAASLFIKDNEILLGLGAFFVTGFVFIFMILVACFSFLNIVSPRHVHLYERRKVFFKYFIFFLVTMPLVWISIIIIKEVLLDKIRI